MVVWIVLLVFAATVFWLLWMPLRVEIDSEAGVFRLEWRHLCAVQWMPDEAPDALRVEAPFFHRTIRLARRPAGKAPQRPPSPPKQARPARHRKTSPRTMWRLTRNMLRSFEIKRCLIVWDSDDFIWNARVYPLALWLSTWGKATVRISFTGERALALRLENRPGRLLWAVLQTFTTKQ